MSEGKDRLKQIRNALGMSQNTFAHHVDIKNDTINNIEGGKQKLSVRVALALRDVVVQTTNGRLRIVTPQDPRRNDEAQLRIDWPVTGEGDVIKLAK